MSASTTRFFAHCLPFLFAYSTQRLFGWEVDPLLLVLGVNSPNNRRIPILTVCPQHSNGAVINRLIWS